MAEARDGQGRDRPGGPAFGAAPHAGIHTHGILRRFARDGGGVTTIEYALIGALIFLVVAGSIRAYATKTSALYGQIRDAVTQID